MDLLALEANGLEEQRASQEVYFGYLSVSALEQRPIW